MIHSAEEMLKYTVRKDLHSMIDLLDLHTHTTASGHAYNSLYEMARSASDKGLALFGCSDHAPAMPGSCHSFHFINFKVLPRTLYGVKLMMGAELNIMDYNGTVDLDPDVLESLDYAIASLHLPCIHSGTAAQNTNAYLGALKNPRIRIIGHPDDSRFPVDYDTLTAAAGEHHKLLEMNNSSLNPLSFRVGARDNYIKMLELCKHYHTGIIINSDAHCEADVGSHTYAHALLKELDFPEELVVNTSFDRFCSYIPKAAAILAQPEDERCGHLTRPRTAPSAPEEMRND